MGSEPFDYDSFMAEIKATKARPFTAGGKTFHLLTPELLSDEQYDAFQAADENDIPTIASLIVDDYAGFIAAGGTAIGLSLIVAEMMKDDDEQGTTPGEGGAS